MIKKESRKGFALGAIVALLASMFGASVPAYAAATEGANISVRPWAGPATNFNGLLTEDFAIYAGLGVGQSNSNWKTVSEVVDIVWEVTETTGLYDVVLASANTYSAVAITVSSLSMDTAGVLSNTDGAIPSVSATIDSSAGSDLSTARTNQAQALSAVSISAKLNDTSKLVHMGLRAVTGSAITSESPNAVITVKIWIDEVGGKNGVHDADEWYTVETVTLHATSRVPVTTAVTGASAGSDWLTVSATVGGLNYENLGGKYYIYAETHDTADSASTSTALSGAVVAERSGVLTYSWALSSLSELTAISVSALYDPSGAGSTTLSAFALGSVASNTATPGDASAVSISIDDDGVNVTESYKVRLNQTYTVRVGATTASGATSVSETAISVAFSGVSLVQFVKEIRVNGGAWTSSLPTAVAVTTGTDGWATFTYETRGFVDGNDLTLTATATGAVATATVEAESNAYTVHNDYHTYAGAPGGAVTVTYQIRDQWNVLSTQDHKLVLTKGGSNFNYAATVSEVTTSTGKASFTFTPEPATATGSATVAAVGYVKDTNGAFVTTGMSNDGNVTIYVGSSTDAFLTTDAIAGSYSVSVSYFPSSLSWTSAITGAAANSGSVVTVAAAGVVFKDAAGNTASDAISVRVGTDQLFTVYATSETSGTYTMTFTNGAATTTSQLIVSEPGSDQGVRIIWDTTTITAGKTKVVTGKLVDATGNPVYTDQPGSVSGEITASILVTYGGTAGIPVGTMPTETDVNGEFRVSILTSAADSGTFTLTAVYSKDGSVTATEDKVTSVQAITVGSAAAAADQKVNAGSFKGYVAVYAKGYEGKRLSAKVGKDWVVVESLASNFERVVEFTGAGYTIAVRIYIDRVLVDTITVTTK